MRISLPTCNCASCQFITKGTVFLQAGKKIEMANNYERLPVKPRTSNGEFFLNMDGCATVRIEPHTSKWH